MRDGEYVGTVAAASTSIETIISHDGRAHAHERGARRPRATCRRCGSRGQRTLGAATRSATSASAFARAKFLGFAGLMGAGRTELARAIFGADPIEVGRNLRGRQAGQHPQPEGRSCAAGIGYLSEDRKHFGLITGLDVAQQRGPRHDQSVFRDRWVCCTKTGCAKRQRGYIRQLSIKTPSDDAGDPAAFGRQPTKGRHRKWLLRDCPTPDLRRANARHRCRREKRKSTSCSMRSRRRGRRSS